MKKLNILWLILLIFFSMEISTFAQNYSHCSQILVHGAFNSLSKQSSEQKTLVVFNRFCKMSKGTKRSNMGNKMCREAQGSRSVKASFNAKYKAVLKLNADYSSANSFARRFCSSSSKFNFSSFKNSFCQTISNNVNQSTKKQIFERTASKDLAEAWVKCVTEQGGFACKTAYEPTQNKRASYIVKWFWKSKLSFAGEYVYVPGTFQSENVKNKEEVKKQIRTGAPGKVRFDNGAVIVKLTNPMKPGKIVWKYKGPSYGKACEASYYPPPPAPKCKCEPKKKNNKNVQAAKKKNKIQKGGIRYVIWPWAKHDKHGRKIRIPLDSFKKSGIHAHYPISGISMELIGLPCSCRVVYRARVIKTGRWTLPTYGPTKLDLNNQPIDKLSISLKKCPGFVVNYMVHSKGKGTGKNANGRWSVVSLPNFAGHDGRAISAVKIQIKHAQK